MEGGRGGGEEEERRGEERGGGEEGRRGGEEDERRGRKHFQFSIIVCGWMNTSITLQRLVRAILITTLGEHCTSYYPWMVRLVNLSTCFVREDIE